MYGTLHMLIGDHPHPGRWLKMPWPLAVIPKNMQIFQDVNLNNKLKSLSQKQTFLIPGAEIDNFGIHQIIVSFGMVKWLAFPWCLVKTVKQVKPYTHHIPRLRNITTKPKSGVESSGQKTLMKPRGHWVNLFSLSFLDWLVVVCGEPRKGTKIENENRKRQHGGYVVDWHFESPFSQTNCSHLFLGCPTRSIPPKGKHCLNGQRIFQRGWLNGKWWTPKMSYNLVVPRAK